MTTLLVAKIVGLIVGAVASIGGARKDSNAGGEKRRAMLLAVLGFGVAVVAELVDATQKQREVSARLRLTGAVPAFVTGSGG